MGDAEEERARSGDEAEAAAEGAEEESIDYDALPFNDVAYWQHFYQADDEMDFYCWYSADEWLPQATERVATRLREQLSKPVLSALDVGCGVSPLLFSLAKDNPAGWGALEGIDFAPQAIEFLAAQAAEADHRGLRFHCGDARDLSMVEDASVDVVIDKGCLDCFVTGDGEGDVGRYLATLARVLAPGGRALLFAVNGADIPRLLRTGEVAPDPFCGAGRAAAAWSERKQAGRAPGDWAQKLWVEEAVAFQEKHLLVCCKEEVAKAPQLSCHECSRTAKGYPDAVPKQCACGNKLRRFALS